MLTIIDWLFHYLYPLADAIILALLVKTLFHKGQRKPPVVLGVSLIAWGLFQIMIVPIAIAAVVLLAVFIGWGFTGDWGPVWEFWPLIVVPSCLGLPFLGGGIGVLLEHRWGCVLAWMAVPFQLAVYYALKNSGP